MAKSTVPGPAVPAPPPSPAGARVILIFVLLFLLYMFDYIDRQVVTSLFPFLKNDLHISDTQAGLLVSAVYWSIVVFVFPVSILIDRWSRRKTIGLMVLLWSIATGAAALVGTYPSLLVTRMGVGVGEAGYSPGGTAMISALFAPRLRSRVLGIWNASIPLGSAIGVLVGGLIAARWGWHRAFGVVALPGFALGILFFIFARDYKTVKLETRAGGAGAPRSMESGEILREFLRKPSLLFTYAGFIGNTFLSTAFLSWLPSYFSRYGGVAESQAGLKTALVLVLAFVGAPLGGFVVDRWMRRRANARPLFAGIASLLAAAVWLAAFHLLSGTPQYLAFMLGAVVSALYISGAAAVTQDVIHPGLWAVSWSICVLAQNLLGSSLAPLVVGAISDANDLKTALGIVPFASAIAGVCFLAAARFYERDTARVEKPEVELEAA
jgi:MFS family permease